jgi:hypothetical protein
MAEKQDEVVVIKQSRLERLKEAAGEKIAQHQRGVAMIKQGTAEMVAKGGIGAGIIEVGGVYAPLITAGLIGAATYYIANSKSVRDIEFVKKHWWARAVAIGFLAIAAFKKGYYAWALALAGLALGTALQDHNGVKDDGKPDSGDPADAGDEAGYWIGERWYPPRYRWDEPRRFIARERWDERLGAVRRAEELADRVYAPVI